VGTSRFCNEIVAAAFLAPKGSMINKKFKTPEDCHAFAQDMQCTPEQFGCASTTSTTVTTTTTLP
jgi:hypothetical protein